MNRAIIYLGVLGLAAAGAAAVYLMPSAQNSTATPTVDLVAGKTIYENSCASCHGASLEGEGDWRSPGPDGRLPPPPHDETGHTWHHPDGLLFTYTKLGGREAMAQQGIEFNSGMPGFGDELTDAEIWDVLGYIKSTWPEKIRKIQADRTAAEAARPSN